MSWDVVLRSPQKAMGSKDQARETFLSACERIVGETIPRRGPTEVAIDPSLRYEVGFIGHKHAIESLSLAIQLVDGDPHQEPHHSVWRFLRGLKEQTSWEVFDTFTGAAID